jgi:hypothetical protein
VTLSQPTWFKGIYITDTILVVAKTHVAGEGNPMRLGGSALLPENRVDAAEGAASTP